MNRETKNAMSRQKILEAAIQEFSQKGYEGASLNTVCAQYGISKGIIYHYFKDKDELYMLCIATCYEALTDHIANSLATQPAGVERSLQAYFDARLCFFATNPQFLGIFMNATLNQPEHLASQIRQIRQRFDELNMSVLSTILKQATLRQDIQIEDVIDDFRLYMDYFNLRFKDLLADSPTVEIALARHEQACHRHVDIMLHGVLEQQ